MRTANDSIQVRVACLSQKRGEMKRDCYIAQRPCGCIVMAVIDTPSHCEETAKEVAECIKDGLVISRVSVVFVREHWECARHSKARKVEQVKERMGMKL